MALDRERLAKIMALTTSDVDGEALAAVRRANAIVKEAGLSWQDILASQNVVNIQISRNAPGAFGLQEKDFSQTSDSDDWLLPHLKDAVVIGTMFRMVEAKRPESPEAEFWTWFDSVHQHWLDHKSLTPKQFMALKKCQLRAARST